METETISSRNVVDLMLNDEFNGASICGKSISAAPEGLEGAQKPFKATTSGAKASGEFILGWDC